MKVLQAMESLAIWRRWKTGGPGDRRRTEDQQDPAWVEAPNGKGELDWSTARGKITLAHPSR